MSNYDKKSGFLFLPRGRLDAYSETIIESMFDQSVDMDEREILIEKEQSGQIRKLSMAKTILFPFEFLAYRIFAGKEFSDQIKLEQSLYWGFLRKKISLEEFKTALLTMNNGY